MTLTSRLIMSSGSVSGSESYTTPGTYYWTAPAGVTKVDVTGQGGSLTSGYTWENILSAQFYVSYISNRSSTLGSAHSENLTFETIEAQVANLATQLNGITTSSSGEQVNSGWTHRWRYNKAPSVDSFWYLHTTNFMTSSNYYYKRSGVFNTSGYNYGTGEIPGNINNVVKRTPTGGVLYRRTSTTTYGTDSTSFGKTFPDNSGQTTHTEVPVVAGTQYTIVVGVDEGSDTSFLNFNYY
jgi:hypothetical protein